MSMEIEYIEATDEYNISGLKYSIEEAKQIAFFIETKEQDKNSEYVDSFNAIDEHNSEGKEDYE